MWGPAPSLDRALDLARGTRAFAVRRDGKGRVLVTYLYADPGVFAAPEARELRGIVYREGDGAVLSRPFHKFFNYREPPHGVGPEAFGGYVYLAPKVDGYLMQVFADGEELVLASRHSLHPPLVGAIAAKLWTADLERGARELLALSPLTLLYEIQDPAAPVMVRPERARVVLLAARRLDTGAYLLPEVHFTVPEVVDCVPWQRVRLDPEEFYRGVSQQTGKEGYVVYLPERNELVKFKTGWAYRLSEFLKAPERRSLEAYAREGLDDLLASLAGREDLQAAVSRAQSYLDALYQEAVERGEALKGLPRREAWERLRASLPRDEALLKPMGQTAMAAYEGRSPRAVWLAAVEHAKKAFEKHLKELGHFPQVGQELRG